MSGNGQHGVCVMCKAYISQLEGEKESPLNTFTNHDKHKKKLQVVANVLMRSSWGIRQGWLPAVDVLATAAKADEI